MELVYCEEYKTRGEALQRECGIKKMSRAEKEALIRSEKSGDLKSRLRNVLTYDTVRSL